MGGGRGKGIKKCDPFESHRIKVLCKSLLHRSRQEGSVAEDVEYVFGCRNEEGLALLDMNAIDMRFTPQTDYHEGGGKGTPAIHSAGVRMFSKSSI